MSDPRYVEVPDGCRVVFVTDQLVELYADWSVIHPCEARATSLRGGPVESTDVVIDVQTRYVA